VKRTHLPLNGLRVLDAAARHLSFTRAADELAVTPAAVGQQIRALEDTLGTILFRRTPKGLELTPEGAAGLIGLRAGFLSFEDAVRAIQAGQTSQSIALAAPRDITAKWLTARLAAYHADNPDLRFMLHASDAGLDFTEANLDLALCFDDGPGAHDGVAVGPRGYVRVGTARGGMIGWPGCPPDDAVTMLSVADAGLALDAAIAGLGHATVPALIAAADIAQGRVDKIADVAGDHGYWLIAPTPQWRQKKVRALVEALSA
jgi:LysR family transcriptional regulator, glycine cleavage system transcriptional activator